MSGKLKIIDGRFCRDGVFEKAEFGNAEQIRLLKENNKLLESYREGVRVYSHDEEATDYYGCECDGCECCDGEYLAHSIEIECPCGRSAEVSEEGYSDDPEEILGDCVNITCQCGREYEASSLGGGEYEVKITKER